MEAHEQQLRLGRTTPSTCHPKTPLRTPVRITGPRSTNSLTGLTAAAGGEFYDLAGPKTNLTFCPLRDIDDDADLAWAVGWVESLCELSGLRVAPRHRNALSDAMMQLRFSPTRTLTEFAANVQDMDIRDALQHFTVAGPLGSLLDAETDSLGSGRMLSFETENLLPLDDKAVIPVLLYLFRVGLNEREMEILEVSIPKSTTTSLASWPAARGPRSGPRSPFVGWRKRS
jgi:hypothetical protein